MPLHNRLRGQMTRHLGSLVLLQELDKKIFRLTAFYAAKLIRTKPLYTLLSMRVHEIFLRSFGLLGEAVLGLNSVFH